MIGDGPWVLSCCGAPGGCMARHKPGCLGPEVTVSALQCQVCRAVVEVEPFTVFAEADWQVETRLALTGHPEECGVRPEAPVA